MAIQSFFSLLSFFFLFLSNAGVSYSAKVPFEARSVIGALEVLEARADGIAGQLIENVHNQRYTTNITINGISIRVLLDTGSTDLWVSPPGGLGNYNSTSLTISPESGPYNLSGTIGVGDVEWGTYSIKQQAFVYVEEITEVNIGHLAEYGIYGILGLALPSYASSSVVSTLQDKYGPSATWGSPVLQNIYQTHSNVTHFIGLDISRGDNAAGSSFTIGEYASLYSAAAQAPKLNIISEVPLWHTYADGITVNGKNINIPSVSIPELGITLPAGKGVAVVDTGNLFTILPDEVLAGIFSLIPGAVKHNYSYTGTTEWIVPCNTTLDVEFVFAGQNFPIHPLDLIYPEVKVLLGVNTTICRSAFHGEGEMWQLGDAFLRNVYSTYNYGNYLQSNKTTDAYIQMISKTNYQNAVQEYTSQQQKWVTSEAPELSPAQALELLLLEEAAAYHPVDHKITVGADGKLLYSPANITAAPGDTVTFIFYPKNHTVTQSNFANPCESLQESTGTVGFKSGFRPVASNTTDFPTFQITVNDTKPIWGYCGQTGHCAAGMVFSINAVESGANTFAAFQDLAKKTASGVSNSTGKSAVNLAADADETSSNDSWITKYGPIIIGLLAGNMLILLALVILSILMYIRRGASSKDTSGLRSVSPYYAPVKTKVDTTGQLGAYDRPYSDQ